MTTLREQMVRGMKLRNYSKRTEESYLYQIKQLAKYYNKKPDTITHEELQDYLIYLQEERHLSFSTCNVARSAIRFLYAKILGDEDIYIAIPARRTPKFLPEVLSQEEVFCLIEATDNYRNRLLLMTAYSAGLRLEELVNLKAEHIDSKRMVIRVVQGKGKKDRYTILSQKLLIEFRNYWRIYQPKSWLFYSKHPDNPLSKSSAQKIFANVKKKAGITRGRGIHTLRHCFATHALEAGYDIRRIQKVLGHKNISTTMVYLHVSRESVSKMTSPLDLYEPIKNTEPAPWEVSHDTTEPCPM